jgi:hypothetical protein
MSSQGRRRRLDPAGPDARRPFRWSGGGHLPVGRSSCDLAHHRPPVAQIGGAAPRRTRRSLSPGGRDLPDAATHDHRRHRGGTERYPSRPGTLLQTVMRTAGEPDVPDGVGLSLAVRTASWPRRCHDALAWFGHVRAQTGRPPGSRQCIASWRVVWGAPAGLASTQISCARRYRRVQTGNETRPLEIDACPRAPLDGCPGPRRQARGAQDVRRG